jgi:hypothetical protein
MICLPKRNRARRELDAHAVAEADGGAVDDHHVALAQFEYER